MLTEISIKRFKAIDQLILPLARINLVIGANNSGKSSLLQAIQFAVSIAQTMKNEGGEWRSSVMNLSFPPDRLVYTPLRDIRSLRHGQTFYEGYYGIEIAFTANNPVPATPPVNGSLPLIVTSVEVEKGRGQNIKCTLKGLDLGKHLTLIKQPYSIFVPGLAGIPMSEEFKSEALVRRAAARGDANNVFRNVLWLLRQNEGQWAKFLGDFQKVFPGRTIEVSFNGDADEHIKCEVVIGYLRLPIDSAGTGVLQAIQILAYIHLYGPKLLILDEPDSHLHPDNQRRLIRLISELAELNNFQVVLSSHSRHILDELEGTARKHWIRGGKRVPDEEYNSINALFEIGALDRGDLLRAGKIKCVVLTEDEDTYCIRELLKGSGFDIGELEIWSYRGCSNRDTAVALARVVAAHAAKTLVLIHRDRDYLTDAEVTDYRTSLTSACNNVDVFVTSTTDAESHFLLPAHLCSVFPALSNEQATNILQRAISDVADESQKAFVNSRLQIESNRLKREGKQVNVGELSVECSKAFSLDPVSFRHGKKVLKRLRYLLQNELKLSANPIQSSAHVADPVLIGVAKKIRSLAT